MKISIKKYELPKIGIILFELHLGFVMVGKLFITINAKKQKMGFRS